MRYTTRNRTAKRALKVMFPSLLREAEAQEQYMRQMKMWHLMHHRGVVEVHDFGLDEQRGLWYLSLEMVKGVTLEHLLRERHAPLSVTESLHLAIGSMRGASVRASLHHPRSSQTPERAGARGLERSSSWTSASRFSRRWINWWNPPLRWERMAIWPQSTHSTYRRPDPSDGCVFDGRDPPRDADRHVPVQDRGGVIEPELRCTDGPGCGHTKRCLEPNPSDRYRIRSRRCKEDLEAVKAGTLLPSLTRVAGQIRCRRSDRSAAARTFRSRLHAGENRTRKRVVVAGRAVGIESHESHQGEPRDYEVRLFAGMEFVWIPPGMFLDGQS